MNRIKLTDETYDLLGNLAEESKMDWWFEEYGNRKTMEVAALSDLSCAILSNNIENIAFKYGTESAFKTYEIFAKADLIGDYERKEFNKGIADYYKTVAKGEITGKVIKSLNDVIKNL